MSAPRVLAFLGHLGIEGVRSSGNGQASAPCPINPGAHAHGDRDPSWSISLSTGAWRCHGCGATGGAYDLALARGLSPDSAMALVAAHGLRKEDRDGHAPIQTPHPTSPGRRSPADTGSRTAVSAPTTTAARSGPRSADEARRALEGWATARALDPAALAALGVRVEEVQPFGWCATWPYHHRTGGRARRLLCLDGRRKPWRGGGPMKGALMVLGELKSATVLLIVEGESDGLSAWAVLGPRFCEEPAVLVVPGAALIPPDLAEWCGSRTVIVALDADGPGDRGAAECARLLGANGDGRVRRVRPEVPGAEKPDVRDLVGHLLATEGDPAGALLALMVQAPAMGAEDTTEGEGGMGAATSGPQWLKGRVSGGRDVQARIAAGEGRGGGWPAPIGPAARIGLVGEFLALIEQQTEADPSLLVVEFLTVAGALMGCGPHVYVGGTRHGANEFMAAVGGTGANGRKGTAFGEVRRLMNLATRQLDELTLGGLGSGEGLIWARRAEMTKEKEDKDGTTREVVIDGGVDDKRALIREGELAGVLQVMARQGSTLSNVLRNAWDGATLHNTVKVAPAKVTAPHFAVVADITPEELRELLTTTDLANGFGNRFLWVLARRRRTLPDGGHVESRALHELAAALAGALEQAQAEHTFVRTPEAAALWHQRYEELITVAPGLYGAATARAEAHVLRLSLIYALLGRRRAITREALEAALEVWRYCADSARWIFGLATGNPTADRILEALRGAGAQGLVRTEVRDLFDRHRAGAQIEQALALLDWLGLARMDLEPSGGRPRERWRAC